MESNLNLGHSLFHGLNDKRGLAIIGYEWGGTSEENHHPDQEHPRPTSNNTQATFSYKTPLYGKQALKWPYDSRIHKWFQMWGHPLSRENLGGTFEKSIVQTNWCNDQNPRITGSIYKKLNAPENLSNFLFHIRELDPELIIFMGSAMINVLQNPSILQEFTSIMGPITQSLQKLKKEFDGRRFYVGFQSFQRCEVISLPHPSGTRGLKDEYINLFTPEIGEKISKFKTHKGII